MSEEKTLTIELERLKDYSFRVDFGKGIESLVTDEAPPVGSGSGPNPSMMLAAAMGNCLSASLLFCLQKSRAPAKGLKTKVTSKTTRNEKGRWRITEVQVTLTPEIDKEYAAQMERCAALFQDFCIVSKSIEQGIPLKVEVDWASS